MNGLRAFIRAYAWMQAIEDSIAKVERGQYDASGITLEEFRQRYICGNPECPELGRCGGECARNF